MLDRQQGISMDLGAKPPKDFGSTYGLADAALKYKPSLEALFEKSEGTPAEIVVPPLIRFLQGQLVLQHSRIFLLTAQRLALQGEPNLAPELETINAGNASKRLGVNFETYHASLFIINLVSEVEHFFSSAVSAALRLYPEKMGNETFKLTEIISASSTDELIDRAAKAKLNSLMYEKPLDYVRSLASILSIDSAKLEELWPIFVELKARRDLGVHSNWVVNEIYLRKLKEAKFPTEAKLGDRLIPNFAYLTKAIENTANLIVTMSKLLAEKWLGEKAEDFGLHNL